MDILKVVGSFALGAVVSLIGRYFFERFGKFTPASLSLVLGCLLGGTAVGYLTNWLKDSAALAFYPVGLLVGIFSFRLIWPGQAGAGGTSGAGGGDGLQPKENNKTAVQVPALAKEDPTFFLIELQKTLRIESQDGSRAHLQRRVKMRANARAQTFWMGTVSADGSIENITVDASVDVDNRIEPNAGRIDIYADFRAMVEPGDEIDIRLEYDLIKTFLKNDEYLGHEVQHETGSVQLFVEFPQARPCIAGSLHRTYAGDTTRVQNVQSSGRGMRLEVGITKPRLGERYRLHWRW
jgi:hypothetical protein